MHRRFNTAGPNDPEDHHTLPVLARLPDARRLIDEKLYFVLHAPRQTGKTTALLALARELTSEGRYTAVVLSMESGAPFRDQVGMAEDAILDAWRAAASRRLPPELRPPPWPSAPAGRRISHALQAWAESAPRPLVVVLDEVDTLEGEALASVLRQLRDGFPDRPHHFPWSLILAGRRDVPDYKIASGGHAEDPFDIRGDTLTLRDFSHDEVAAFYGGHTQDTGQLFLPVAIDRAYRLTRGQPWLVNALARQIVEVVVPDRTIAITASHLETARTLLVPRPSAHFDSLAELLHEPRIRAILEPMLRGEPLGTVSEEDRRLVLDLGLVRSSDAGALAIANPIYREVLERLLASGKRAAPPQLTATWIPADGLLDEDPPPTQPGRFLESPASPALTPSQALATAKWAPLESFPPEELTEWFRPVSTVLPPPVDQGPTESAQAGDEGDATGRRLRLRRAVALGAAGCAVVAVIAWLAGNSESPASATPATVSPSVASMLTPPGRSTETPHSAPTSNGAESTATSVPETRDAPRPSSEPDAGRAIAPARSVRAPVRMPRPAAVGPEPRQESRVVPSLPTLAPPDEDQLRRTLEPKVWSGDASIEEIRMLKAICSDKGDHACRDRASEMLKRKEP